MLKKLLKYDLQWIINKVLSYYYAATLLAAVFARVFHALADTATIWLILEKIFTGAFISCAIAIVINALMRSLVCFRRTVYGDPSYLTHTLPIPRSTVFTAKTLAGSLSLLISVAVAVIGVAVVELTQGEKREAVAALLRQQGACATLLLLGGILILELLFMQLCAVWGLVQGHRALKSRIARSVLLAVGAYLLLSAAILGLCFVLSFLNPQVHAVFTDVVTSQELFTLPVYRAALAVALGLYLLVDLGLFFTARQTLKKGVDVE